MRSIFVSICGAPNAGKSTLVNMLVGQKITIVSPKVQTTRTVVRGILTERDVQVVLLDTPGVFKPKRMLEKTIVKNAHSGIRGGQIACLVIDGTTGLDKNVNFILQELKEKDKTIIIVVNKVDLMRENQVIKTLHELFDGGGIAEIFPISAKTGEGVIGLKNFFIRSAEDDVWYYDANDVTDKDFGFATSEITREKLYLKLDKELPYNLCVETDEIVDGVDCVEISQTVYVHKQSQKNIVIGRQGATISGVVKEASGDMKELFDKPVKIKAFVKVRENWMSANMV